MTRISLNALLASGCLLLLLFLVSYSGVTTSPQKAMTVRKVNTVTLPPPPVAPPQRPHQPQKQNTANLHLSSTASPITLAVSPVPVPLPKLSAPVIKQEMAFTAIDTFHTSNAELAESLLTFRLDELDNAPRLLRRIRAKLPRKLTAQGIKNALLVLHVIIHETGQVELVKVADLPYSELEPLVTTIIQQALFTAPMRHGAKVKAEFLWPIKVSA